MECLVLNIKHGDHLGSLPLDRRWYCEFHFQDSRYVNDISECYTTTIIPSNDNPVISKQLFIFKLM